MPLWTQEQDDQEDEEHERGGHAQPQVGGEQVLRDADDHAGQCGAVHAAESAHDHDDERHHAEGLAELRFDVVER